MRSPRATRAFSTPFPTPTGLLGRALLGQTYVPVHEGGEYRPDWTWVALRDGTTVARAAWWAKPGDEKPVALDWFDFAEGEDAAAAELLRTAPLDVEYEVLLPPGWLDRPEHPGRRRAPHRRGHRGRHEAAGRTLPLRMDAGLRAAGAPAEAAVPR